MILMFKRHHFLHLVTHSSEGRFLMVHYARVRASKSVVTVCACAFMFHYDKCEQYTKVSLAELHRAGTPSTFITYWYNMFSNQLECLVIIIISWR